MFWNTATEKENKPMFNHIDSDELYGHLNKITDKIDTTAEYIDELEKKIDELNDKISNLIQSSDEDNRVANLERKIDENNKFIQQLLMTLIENGIPMGHKKNYQSTNGSKLAGPVGMLP